MSEARDVRGADILPVVFACGSTAVELSRLLGMGCVPGKLGGGSFINEELDSVLRYHNRGQYDFRDLQLLKLSFFTKHLREIEAYDPKLLKSFAKEFRRRQERDQYVGLRFEVEIAASLIRKRIPFDRSESPDFLLQWDGEPIAIECTSAMLPTPRDGDVARKITQRITNKGEKQYANSRTVLFIDITDVLHRANLSGRPLQEAELVTAVQEGLRRSTFGCVVLFFHVMNVHEERMRTRFEQQFLPVPSPDCAPPLAAFLQSTFALRKVVKPGFVGQVIPRAG